MGAGKSTIGGRLAARLGWPLRDSDTDIEARHGQSVRELRETIGVDGIHDLEAAHVLDSLAAEGPTVIAAAASVIDVAECRVALSATDILVVWLRASPAALAARFRSRSHRPTYGADPATFLADQAKRRNVLFAAVARTTVDTQGIKPDEAVDMIVRVIWTETGGGG